MKDYIIIMTTVKMGVPMSLSRSHHISTHNVVAEERKHYWLENVREHIIQVDCPTCSSKGIHASLKLVECDQIKVSHIEADSHSILRSPADIENDKRRSIFLCAMQEGSGFSWQGTICANHVPGDIVLYDTGFPYAQGFSSNMAMLVVDIPRAILDASLEKWQQRDLVKIDRSFRIGNISANNVWALLHKMYQHSSGQGLSEQLLSQLSVLLSYHAVPSSGRSRYHLLQRCLAYIEQHLEHDELDVEHLAEVMNTSTRQLSRAFELKGISVSRYIWNLRLERCREEIITSPGTNIGDIAFKWGFNHSAHFSRSYKRRFDEAPVQTRKRHKLVFEHNSTSI